MKWLKKGLLLLIVLSIVVGICGCTTKDTLVTDATSTEPAVTPKNNPAAFVRFSRSTEPREQYVSVEELQNYESQYSDCNGTWFRDQLSGEDLTIYNSYLYAMENRFIGFEVYVADSDKDFSYIREMLSLDSPFLEQNYSHYEHIWKQPISYAGERIMVRMEQFTDSRWDMKMEALEKCRQIVANIPDTYKTQQEKMEYLYDYVCDHVAYVEYERMEDESYFYDAVCKGETVCDGYSNMLSLLFRLIGVESIEAMGHNEGDQTGHTWVVAKLNGVFYNFDATYEDTGEKITDGREWFGYSDDLTVENIEFEKQRPKCTDTSRDFSYVDLIVSSLDGDEVQRIAAVTEDCARNGKYTTAIAITDVVEESELGLFGDRYYEYISNMKEISIVYAVMGNSTLMGITVTPR